MNLPPPVQGPSRQAGWLNKLRSYVESITPRNSSDIRIGWTTRGVTYQLASAGAAGASVRQYILKSVGDDYLVCRSWDGTNETSDDVYIARPWLQRRTEFDGNSFDYSSDGDVYTVSYSYSSATKRTATINGTDETQVLIPHFKADSDLIYAVTAGGLGVEDAELNEITLLDLNVDGRAWAKI